MDGWSELTAEKIGTKEGVNEVNRMMKVLFEMMPGDGETVRIYKGNGSPDGVVSAGVGSLYKRLDSGDYTLYIKESGTDASGWIPYSRFNFGATVAQDQKLYFDGV